MNGSRMDLRTLIVSLQNICELVQQNPFGNKQPLWHFLTLRMSYSD